MALRSWLRLPVLALATLSCTLVSATSHSFENTAIVRTVDLGGSLVSVTTTYAIRALDDGAQKYVVSFGEKEAESIGWFEAKLKGQRNPLPVKSGLLDPHQWVVGVLHKTYTDASSFIPYSGTYSYTVELPESLSVDNTVNLVVETVHTHTTYAWPPKAGQEEEQSVKYEGDLLVLSPYKTATQRIKVRCAIDSYAYCVAQY
jgi:oligosaccharyltransferase complex subunit alpha (ribophorin I)